MLAHASKDPKACSEAESLKNKIEEFEFLVAVVFWYDILTQINVVSKILQQKTSNLSMALELIEKIIIWLADYISHGFTDAVNTANQIAMEIEIEPTFQYPTLKRKSKKKRMFDYN